MTGVNLSRIQFINVNSLASHRQQITTSLLTSPSILALCETKLASDSTLFKISNFDGHNFPFKLHCSGGSVVRNSLPNREVPSLSYDSQGSMMRHARAWARSFEASPQQQAGISFSPA